MRQNSQCIRLLLIVLGYLKLSIHCNHLRLLVAVYIHVPLYQADRMFEM